MTLYSSVHTYIALCLIARKWRITMSSREVKRLLERCLGNHVFPTRLPPSNPSIHMPIHLILKPEIGMPPFLFLVDDHGSLSLSLSFSRARALSLLLRHCHFRDLNVGHPTLCRLRGIRSARQITMWRCRKNFETKRSICTLGYKNERHGDDRNVLLTAITHTASRYIIELDGR